MIKGVEVIPLRRIPDERGGVLHMLRKDAPHFQGFGEVYFSTVLPGAVKAWKRHRKMTLNLAVPMGRVRFVLYDSRPRSPTRGTVQDVVLAPDETYALLIVPPMVWNGFTALSHEPALIANCATLPHDPDECDRLPPDDPGIPYRWAEHASGNT